MSTTSEMVAALVAIQDMDLTGPQGPQGPEGPEGQRGPTGPEGPEGPRGAIGLPGKKGDKGDKGERGAAGPKGDRGPQGAKGEKGERGRDGADGASAGGMFWPMGAGGGGGGGGGALAILDEGVSQGTATSMNFAGATVSASVAANVATVTVTNPNQALPYFLVAASNAPAAVIAAADYACDGTNDAAQIQAAIDALPAAGGTVVLSVGTFNLIGQGSITTDSLTQAYCVKIVQTNGAVTLRGQGIGATVLKLANSQATNTIPILVRGTDAANRLGPTLLTQFEVQGNTANQPAWSDFGLIEMAYAQQTALDLVKISDAPWFLLQNFRKSTDTRIARSTFVAAGANNQVRFETSNFTISECRFEGVAGATAGTALSLSPNDDIGNFFARDGRIFANVFINGFRGVSISGGSGNLIADNEFLMGTAADDNATAIYLEHFVATLNFDAADNIIVGNKIDNAGTAIRLTSTTTYGSKHNIVAHNMITNQNNAFYGVREDGASADNNRIIDNELDASFFTADYATVGANTVVRKPNFGTSSAAVGTSAAGTSQNPAHSDHVHATGAGTPSTQAFGDAAATGTGPAAAMTDHKHGMPANPVTFAAPALTLGTANAAGAASTLIRTDATILAFDATTPAAIGTAATGAATVAARRDHVHATGAGTPSTQAMGDAAATGTGPAAAMTDHKHAMPAFATNAILLGTAAAAGGATTPMRSNDTIAAFDATAPTTAAFGDAAAAGSVAFAARRDHLHGQTSLGTTPGASAMGDTQSGGSATTASKNDHRHARSTATNKLFLPAADAKLDSATAANVGASPDLTGVVAYADAATQGAIWSFMVPSDWVSGVITLQPVWSPGSTDGTSHTVRWSMTAKTAAAGTTVTSAGTTTAFTGSSAARTVGVLVYDTATSTTLTPAAAGDLFRFTLQRIGADANDTYVGVVNLLGVIVSYTANT